MERVNRILSDGIYKKYLEKNNEMEADRKFCRHNMTHFLDVARIGAILNQKETYGQEQEIIYAAALLHDIGRWKQYEDGTPHERAGAELSAQILLRCGFTEKESKTIQTAIGNHRNSEIKGEKSLSGLLYRADKISRPCYLCEMEKECNWKEKRKNRKLEI